MTEPATLSTEPDSNTIFLIELQQKCLPNATGRRTFILLLFFTLFSGTNDFVSHSQRGRRRVRVRDISTDGRAGRKRCPIPRRSRSVRTTWSDSTRPVSAFRFNTRFDHDLRASVGLVVVFWHKSLTSLDTESRDKCPIEYRRTVIPSRAKAVNANLAKLSSIKHADDLTSCVVRRSTRDDGGLGKPSVWTAVVRAVLYRVFHVDIYTIWHLSRYNVWFWIVCFA